MKKNVFYLLMLILGGLIFTTSCDNDDPDPIIIDNPVYGMQVTGTATDGNKYVIDVKQVVEPSSDFATKVTQTGMYYGIFYLKAGQLSFSEVTAGGEVTYSAAGEVTTQTAETGEDFTYLYGDLTTGGTGSISIASEGLYYIMTDNVNFKFWVMQINNFEINVTGDKATKVSGSAAGAVFEVKGVELRAAFKLRMNTAWKIIAEDVPFTGTGGTAGDHARPVISYGGAIDNLTPEGGDIAIDNGGKLLDFTITWNPAKKGIAGITITTADGGILPPPAFPEHLYMTGASIGAGAWDWTTNGVELVPARESAHLFWRIVWIENGVADAGFKFSPELDWGPSFGVTGAATAGVYAKGGDNVPANDYTSGYYMVVVNLLTETIEINAPQIYGIGAAFGGWDAAVPANIFTVDNVAKKIISPALTASDNVRMHVAAATLTDAAGVTIGWWNAEFNVIGGNIEYRGTGGDQAAVPGTVGQVVTLDFIAGTGTIL